MDGKIPESLQLLLQQALEEPIGAGSQARVISLDHGQPTGEWPEAVIWSSALEWLLQA